MRNRIILIISLSCLICLQLACQVDAPERAALERPKQSAEVVVYGATPGGIVAAVAAKRSGRSVLLLEPGARLGGVVSGGLVVSDVCQTLAIGATAREFFKRVGNKYDQPVMWNFEPHVAEEVFQEMVDEAGVEVLFGQQLASVEKEGSRIKSLTTTSDERFLGRVFIDGTYEGDLLAAAGVSYAVGRESRETYGEQMAGGQPPVNARQFDVPVDAYDENGKLLPGIQEMGLPELGKGDKKVMGYNFRFCMTPRPELQVEIPKPKTYDRKEYELLARYLKAKPDLQLDDLMAFHHAYQGKFCINRQGPLSTNFIGENWEWPEATPERRKELFEAHKEHTLGLLHFLKSDPAVPEHIRTEMARWGFCKDEFTDSDHFPFALYVREARRMIGRYVLRESDLLENRRKDDGIGLASCPIEVHHVQRVATEDGLVKNEGHLGYRVKAYAIPYRSVTPKQAECDNLLVPVAISASQVAYSSLRMEPVYMILGHGVGVAASMAVENDVAVQDVDVTELRNKLKKHTQVL